MASPSNRRSKENSTISPSIPLPGIALGLFAALAASFAASRALRRKTLPKNLEDEPQSGHEGNPPFKEKEMESKDRSDESPFLIQSNGTITIAQEPSKLAAGSLKPVFDAIEEVSFVAQGRDAVPLDGEEDFGEDGECEEAGSEGDLEENEKGEEIMEKGKLNVKEGEIAEVVVEIEASVAVDDAAVEAIREKGGGQGEREAGRKRLEGEGNGVNIVIKDEDICGDDERTSADQQPSPVLINGKKLDFSDEIPDTKDGPPNLSSESNSLSDGVSESSAQEVGSTPVRPFVSITEDSLEAERTGAKLGLPTDLNQSGQGIGQPEDKQETPINFGLPSTVMEVRGYSEDLEGKDSKVNGLDEGIADLTTNNAEVLSNGSSSPKELDDCESLGECELAVQSTSEVSVDDFAGLQDKGESIAECALIDGNDMPLDDSPDNLEAMTTDETNFQKGQEGTDSTKSDIHRNSELLAASELSGDKTCVSSDNDHLYDDEFTDEKACLECDTSDEGAGAESIPEELKPQLATQNLGTAAADNVEQLEQEQPNLPVASKGVAEGSELGSGGSTGDANREDKDDELFGELLIKDREQEAELTTRLYEPNDRTCEKMAQTFVVDSAHVSHNRTREADGFLLKGGIHQHGWQPKGVSVSKAFEYLPLEILFFFLLIALLSYVLWYLEMLPAISHQVELAETY